MLDFDFCAPTHIIFGNKKEAKIGEILKEYGIKKVLIHCGQSSIKRSGLLDFIIVKLKENNIEYIVLDGVEPNPKLELVKRGVALITKQPVDLILAVGGGSVIDSAKLIAQGYYYEKDPFDFILGVVKPKKALPIGVILTISAAGSESSSSCVITDEKSKIKRGFNSTFNRPLFVIMNPELTYTVNKYHTACGIVDILMHTLERYYNQSTDNELSDNLAVGLIKSTLKAGLRAFDNPNDYEARATLMLASSLSHNGITGLGKTNYMPVHQLEHALSGEYDFVAHGAGLAVLFPAWARYYAKINPKKFAQFAKEVFNIDGENELEIALSGITKVEDYFKRIEMPKTYEDLNINQIDIEKMVNVVTLNKTKSVPYYIKDMDAKIVEEIFMSCIKE